ncbi:MAG: hypothetical protein O6940_14130 [Ignavibacteria bacterium]|nr:hypothetical protein [Ignavibacteria bacterium]
MDDDLHDFLEGDILGNQISSSQIENLLNYNITHSGNIEKITAFMRKLDIKDLLAIQRVIAKKISSICDRNKNMFGSFIFAYFAITLPLSYVWIFESDFNFDFFVSVLTFLIISIILISGFWNMGKEWKYLNRLVKKDELCKDAINERLIILLKQEL